MTQILGRTALTSEILIKLLSSGREFASCLFNTELKYRAFLGGFASGTGRVTYPISTTLRE